MSRLSDLRERVGKTVYLSTPIMSMYDQGSATIKVGKLLRVDGITCVVEWTDCMCLDDHSDDTDPCQARLTDRVSIFTVQTIPPRRWTQSDIGKQVKSYIPTQRRG